MGIYGIGISFNLSLFIQLMIVVIYTSVKKEISEAVTLPDKESFKHWGEYLALAIPGTVMTCAEWWSYELLTLMSGTLGVTN